MCDHLTRRSHVTPRGKSKDLDEVCVFVCVCVCVCVCGACVLCVCVCVTAPLCCWRSGGGVLLVEALLSCLCVSVCVCVCVCVCGGGLTLGHWPGLRTDKRCP